MPSAFVYGVGLAEGVSSRDFGNHDFYKSVHKRSGKENDRHGKTFDSAECGKSIGIGHSVTHESDGNGKILNRCQPRPQIRTCSNGRAYRKHFSHSSRSSAFRAWQSFFVGKPKSVSQNAGDGFAPDKPQNKSDTTRNKACRRMQRKNENGKNYLADFLRSVGYCGLVRLSFRDEKPVQTRTCAHKRQSESKYTKAHLRFGSAQYGTCDNARKDKQQQAGNPAESGRDGKTLTKASRRCFPRLGQAERFGNNAGHGKIYSRSGKRGRKHICGRYKLKKPYALRAESSRKIYIEPQPDQVERKPRRADDERIFQKSAFFLHFMLPSPFFCGFLI